MMDAISPIHEYANQDPFTPVKTSHPHARLQSSPFSDYFTDDGRSPDDAAAPSPEKRQLLVRLNSLQSQLIHGDSESEQQTMEIIERKTREIESQINALHSQTRMPPEMEDSGLFMEEDEAQDEDEDRETDDRKYKLDSHSTLCHDSMTAKQKQADSDHLLLESQRVLESVAKANEQLRQRLTDTKTLHEQHARDLETRDQEIGTLRTENEALKTDLAFDHSELLFLQLQFKALEVEVTALDQGAQRLESYAPDIKEDIQRVKRERIAEEMGKWRQDWEQVDARMGRRRRRYLAVLGSDKEGDAPEDATDEWHLETVRENRVDGKVHRITIQRANDGEGSTLVGIEDPDLDTGEVESSTSHQPEADCGESSMQEDVSSANVLVEPNQDIGDELIPAHDDSDCAITTSSEDDRSQFSDDEEEEFRIHRKTVVQSSLSKTAWQELWEGLAGLAGMGEDRFT